MANFITEDMIEQTILQKLGKPEFGYDVIVCDSDPAKRELLPDGTGRAVKTACVLPHVLTSALHQLAE